MANKTINNNCLISYRAGVWHYRILPDFFINSNFMMAANATKVALRTCWHWSCASTFCKNSWKTPNVEYYTLTKVGSAPKTVQDAYLKVLGKRKEDVNFKKLVICSMHWSCGKRLRATLPNNRVRGGTRLEKWTPWYFVQR